MKATDIQSVLVVGIDTVALVTSAKKAGYNVFAADYFGDQDLKKTCIESLSITTQMVGKSCGFLKTNFSPHTFLDLTKKLLAKHEIDAALLASGLEETPLILRKLKKLIPIIGNQPKTIEKVRNKPNFFQELKRIGINHPKTVLAENLEEAKRAVKDIGYPTIAKPATTLGGIGIRKIRNGSELSKIFPQIASANHGVLIQEFIPGIHSSVSFLASKEDAKILTLNEQLLGTKEVGQREPFGYCGNIVPASNYSAFMDVCREIVRKIASHFKLMGSNGIDLVISKDGVPYVVEVNPRFQGTLECVERVLGINLVYSHMKACIEGQLSLIKRDIQTFCIRLIMYAHQQSVAPKLDDFREVRDIPLVGTIIEEGEPLCSVVIEGRTRSATLKKAVKLAEFIYGMTEPRS